MSRRSNTATAIAAPVLPENVPNMTPVVEGVVVSGTSTELPAIDTVDLSEFTSKSAKMRHLASLGYKTSPIAKVLGVKYQFVRNVLNQSPPAKPVVTAE